MTLNSTQSELNKRWYSVKEAAEVLSIGKSTLRRRLNSGCLRFLEVDGQMVIPRSQLAEALHGQQVVVRAYRRRSGAAAHQVTS